MGYGVVVLVFGEDMLGMLGGGVVSGACVRA